MKSISNKEYKIIVFLNFVTHVVSWWSMGNKKG